MENKRKMQTQKLLLSITPKFISASIFACSLPHSFLLYQMVWADPCSDAFFWALESSLTWVSVLTATEAAAGVGLGYVDFNTKTGQGGDKSLVYAMRKKRLAFAKFPLVMSSIGMFLLNTPSPHVIIPLALATGWSALKMST